MTTLAAEIEPASPNLTDYLVIARRRLRPMLIAAAAGVVTTVLLALFWPPRYQSIATILIEQQEMPIELVRSTVTSYADQRVQVISQRVMTTQTLLGIIRQYNLYPRQRERESREVLIARMRKDIDVKMISADVIDPKSGHPTSATIAFTVAYSNPSPDQAARVANELTTQFLNENLTTRTKLADDAANFLEGEGDRVSHRIAELETKLATFKSKHVNELPDLVQLNMQLLDRTSQDLRQTETRQSSLEQQEVYLQAQLAQLKPNSAVFSESGDRILSTADRLKTLRSQLASARALYAPDHPDIARLSREIAGLEGQSSDSADVNDLRRNLDDTRAQLAQAREKYGPEHPDRIRLEREVESLQRDLDVANAAALSNPAAQKAAEEHPDNPAFIQIKSQLDATRDDLRALGEQQTRLRAEISSYQHKITVSPQIEKEYRELMRDYENAHARYQELRLKQGEATVAKNLESGRKGERFTLIEPPLTPQEPVSPNRPLVLTLGLVLSMALAAGVAALAESLDATVRGRGDLMSLVAGTAPLAIIPIIATDLTDHTRWRRRAIAIAAVAATIIVIGTAVHLFYRPLDVVWFVLLRRFGLA
jgi:succinoglycan biosynthesis transport protein ExoP